MERRKEVESAGVQAIATTKSGEVPSEASPQGKGESQQVFQAQSVD